MKILQPYDPIQEFNLRSPYFVDPYEPVSNWDRLGAAFRQNNAAASLFSNLSILGQMIEGEEDDPDYDPYSEIAGTPYQPFLGSFAGVRSRKQAQRIKAQIDQELRDRQILDEGGWTGTLMSLTAGVLDPINLIPLWGVGAKGATALRGAVRLGAAGFAGVSMSEAALQSTQETRPWQESAANIAAGTLLTGVLGGVVGGMSRSTVEIAGDALQDAVRQPTGLTISGGVGTGRSSVEAFDQALNRGMINEGMHRMAVSMLRHVDRDFDLNTTVELIDAARYADDAELKIYGLNPDDFKGAPEARRPQILGQTIAPDRRQDMARSVIKLYTGADADTWVEEFYHRAFDWMPQAERRAFAEYHARTKDTRSLHEHFAQEGRDWFFSNKLHEQAGPIRQLFQKAKAAMMELIGRVRKIRGAQIPKKIEDLYRRAGTEGVRVGDSAPGSAEAVFEYGGLRSGSERPRTLGAEENRRLAKVDHIEGTREYLAALGKNELRNVARERGIPVGGRSRAQLVEAILEDEARLFDQGQVPKEAWRMPGAAVAKIEDAGAGIVPVRSGSAVEPISPSGVRTGETPAAVRPTNEQTVYADPEERVLEPWQKRLQEMMREEDLTQNPSSNVAVYRPWHESIEIGSGLKRKPIHLEAGDAKEGIDHIRTRSHEEQILKQGFKDAPEFIAHVLNGFDRIFEGRNDTVVLGRSRPGKKGKSQGFVDVVVLAEKENYYKIISAFPAKSGYVKNKKTLWDAAQLHHPDRTPGALGSDQSVLTKTLSDNSEVVNSNFAGAGETSFQIRLPEVEQKAVDTFGTTDDPARAGFILPDGRMIDISQKEITKEALRQYHHFKVALAVVPEYENGFDGVDALIEKGGWVRLNPDRGGIELAGEPTAEQYAQIRRYLDTKPVRHWNHLMIDIRSGEGREAVFESLSGREID
jgi:hypothetical protein